MIKCQNCEKPFDSSLKKFERCPLCDGLAGDETFDESQIVHPPFEAPKEVAHGGPGIIRRILSGIAGLIAVAAIIARVWGPLFNDANKRHQEFQESLQRPLVPLKLEDIPYVGNDATAPASRTSSIPSTTSRTLPSLDNAAASLLNRVRDAALTGDADAMNRLGLMYLNGEGGLNKDETSAVQWFMRAAEAGSAIAMNNLGAMYVSGRGGLVANDEEGVRWYRKAAEAGCGPAMTNLAASYYEGRANHQDYAEAMKWYRKAESVGEVRAMTDMGYLYENGKGVIQDYAEAMKWYLKAAEAGDARAINGVGCLYFNGHGVTKDYVEATKWFQRAAAAGDDHAMNSMGSSYLNGRGIAQDDAEGLKWFRKAADAGNVDGMTNVGLCYKNGWGVPRDLGEALKWFHKAADLGNDLAKQQVDILDRPVVAVSSPHEPPKIEHSDGRCLICKERLPGREAVKGGVGKQFDLCDDCQHKYQAWRRACARFQPGLAFDAADQKAINDFNALMSANFHGDDNDARRGIGIFILTGKLGSPEWEALTRGSSDDDRKLGERLDDPERWLSGLDKKSQQPAYPYPQPAVPYHPDAATRPVK
jgi:TPR repeat protein